MNQQHSRRPPPRLLLLAGLTVGAGVGLALAAGSPAHASDQPDPTHRIAGVVRAATDAPARLTEPATRKPADRPRPVRDLTAHTRRAVDQTVADTSRAVRHVTDTLDEATRPVPVVGRTVDTVTDIADRVVDTTTAVAARPEPANTDVAPPGVDHEPTGVTPPAAGTPQTAPEPAPPGPPTLGGVSSGAPTTQHPTAGHHRESQPRTQPAAAHTRERPTVTIPDGPQASDGCSTTHRLGDTTRTLDYVTTGSGWAAPPPPGLPAHGHPEHHDGRTQSPSPPPG
ncbi:hypothetical protein AB0K35_27570 [Micromonospora sp. NPDC053740]|uniref:hypothetical protein n=1 Tax=Micromonospora sp. NPDC053740 TaxID=3155173 RepID=UPI0034376B58